MLLRRTRIALAGLIALLACAAPAGAQDPDAPGTGPGGPVLVAAGDGDAFSRYYAEILRAEGLNAFAVTEGELTASTLAAYRVVVLGRPDPTAAEVAALTTWVQNGGALIAMRPGAQLAPLLGLAASGGTIEQGYLDVTTTSGPGKGITGVPMQFHGVADRWVLAGAQPVASLQTGPGVETGAPAVTLRSVGSKGGQAAAFAYDLAASVIETRQGNPDWSGDERDGVSGIRPDDLFFPDWVDFANIRIPQADEQQRLLANLITDMSLDALPMPRFWYLPRDERAAVVMTGDDHQTDGGTIPQFTWFDNAGNSPAGCSVAEWQCVRATSYLYTGTSMQPATSQVWADRGFEIAVHLNTSECAMTAAEVDGRIASQRATFEANVGRLSRTMRSHCAAWPDWASTAKAEAAHGIRLDTNYYYWPAAWVADRPGMFTGSGFPMRFSDVDGTIYDTYQATTQVTDEIDTPPNFPVVGDHVAALLDGAIDDGFYGTFTVNMHTDEDQHLGARAIVAEAKERGVPVISAEQLLDWTDGRNESTFTGLSYAGGALSFTVVKGDGATGLQGMVPAATAAGALQGITRNGAPVAGKAWTVKGIAYVKFDAQPGAYVARYRSAGGPGQPPPTGPSGNPPAPDTTKPYLTLRKRFVRANRKGRVVFVATCPASEARCAVDFRIVRKGKRLARTRLTLAGGKTAKVRLKLSRAARRKLARKSPLVARAVIRITDASGNTATQRTPVTLYGPRRR